MSDLKPKGKIKLGNSEYGLRFTLNAIDDLQDKFKIDIDNLTDLFNDPGLRIKATRYLITLLINEDIDATADETGKQQPHVDERFVGRYIGADNISEIAALCMTTFAGSLPEAEEEDAENPPMNE